MTNEIINAIEQSEMWKQLNANIKALYEDNNREASEEEYQALRKMMIMKVMAEDPNICEVAAKSAYNEFNA